MNMQAEWEILHATRSNMLAVAESLTLAQLNTIPAGFNNNPIWQVGHVIATQQVLCYERCGLPPQIDPALVARYRKGTRPEEPVTATELTTLLTLLRRTPTQIQASYEAGQFREFARYETSFGYVLRTIEDAIRFGNVHEGLHLGYLMAQRRAVQAGS